MVGLTIYRRKPIAGAHGANPGMASFDYGDVVKNLGGPLASAMLFLFAIASIPPTCFCAFIAGNSFSTMLPGVPRMSSTMVGVTVATNWVDPTSAAKTFA